MSIFRSGARATEKPPKWGVSGESLPPPYMPDLSLIGWLEDYRHGPAQPRSWRCWLSCPHGNES